MQNGRNISRARRRLGLLWRRLPVDNGPLAMALLYLAVLFSGLESAYVQAVTTYQAITADLLRSQSFLLLLGLDIALPFIVASLSRRAFVVMLAGQCFMSVILLHYTIFFYNPLTLSTIYHSMQGAASLGIDIFGFARPEIILAVGLLFAFKLLLVRLSSLPYRRMPRLWNLRGVAAICAMALVVMLSTLIYGKTGLSVLWVDSAGHRTATERRLEEGTREAVRNIGYLATWIGEWMSGTYKDTDLIYAEQRCPDPDHEKQQPNRWNGLPLPPFRSESGGTVILMQVESLDFAALGLRVNGQAVLPFTDKLAAQSLLLQVYAPHKVGSSNSDYEILNGRVAEQNVIYYSYIKDYPDSVIHLLTAMGYRPALFHGLGGSLFNLRPAYQAQGFESFHFKEELLAAGYKPGKYIMEHVMDEDVFAAAAALLTRQEAEQKAGQERQAQFIITMSSHIPFIDPLPNFKNVGGSFARYVSSLHYFDQCLAAYYERLPPGTLLLIWGDHGSDVDYPRGFPANGRRVPFMAHMKGNAGWYAGAEEAAAWRLYTLCELHYYLCRILE